MQYTLKRSRRKTLAIHVKADCSVEVRAPLHCPKREIERFIRAKAAWIENTQKKIAEKPPAEQREMPPPQYLPGEFERSVHELAAQWGARMGVTAAYIGIRTMTTRWGSCTAKTRRIRINAMLQYCPRECLEYVVAHELAHLRENNHSPRFWAIMAEAMPDYKARRKTLKTMSWLLNRR